MINKNIKMFLTLGIVVMFFATTNAISINENTLYTLFSDNFDDNSIDSSKWTIVKNDGTVDETGGRMVFMLHENNPTLTISVESKNIEADIGSVEISCDMITYIDHNSGYVGQLAFIVEGQGNNIAVRYFRASNDLKVYDTKGTDITLFNADETSTPWGITLTIEENRYEVEVDGYSTGWISKSILSHDEPFNVDMYMEINGDYPEFWWKAGFDNVFVNGDPANTPPIASFTWDPNPICVGKAVTFTSTSFDPDGDITNYAWDFTNDGIHDANGEVVTHVYGTVGTYEVSHWVAGDKYYQQTPPRSDQDQIEKTVAVINCDDNIPPIANFFYSISGSTVHVDASISEDPDGTIVDYNWSFGDGSTGSGKITSHTYSSFIPFPTTYGVTLIVTDNDGAKDAITKSINARSKDVNYPFFRFLENHPHMFPLLRQIFGLE